MAHVRYLMLPSAFGDVWAQLFNCSHWLYCRCDFILVCSIAVSSTLMKQDTNLTPLTVQLQLNMFGAWMAKRKYIMSKTSTWIPNTSLRSDGQA